ncbi:response regulator [Candidatus Nitrospira bockiana]
MKKLLLVEDEPHSRTMLEWVLTSYGYQVESIDSGAGALALLRHRHFDGILLDIMLIDLDGFEVLRQLKAEAYDAPILVITGYHYLALKAVRDGADDFLVKPFANRNLRTLIERWVGPAQVGAACG